jgi:hypothetical protein
MPEVTDSREGHGEAGVIGGADYCIVANRTTRLDDGGGARFGNGKQTVGEREECVRRGSRTFG